jgi:hypothetical protein
MALKGKIILETNLGTSASFEDAYVKVLDVSSDKNTGNINVGIFESQNGRLICTQRHPFVPSMDGPNFIKQCYEQIKRLPVFANCQSC